MNILIIGSGAREHAIAKALSRSSHKPNIYCCGTSHNPGIFSLSRSYWIGDINNVKTILAKAVEWKIEFAIIGPENPLEKGLADILWENHIPVIGPKQKLAQLETSKAFTRDLLKKYNISGSPAYQVFSNMHGAREFLLQLGEGNYVIKANGLMGGKGVKVAGDHLHSIDEALQFCEEIINANQTVVIEEKLLGQEFSLHSFCDGYHLTSLPCVQDHKRVFVNDEGPNTGGMGSYSDSDHRLPFLTERELEDAKAINAAVIAAVTAECEQRYIGILYGSFMATKDGVRLIEYNVRFGDPEAMNILATLESDFVDICLRMVRGDLQDKTIKFSKLATVCKYAVPQGYPNNPKKDFVIDISAIQNQDQLYFAAVDERAGVLYATGSRTIAVVGIAEDLFAAEQLAETEIKKISGPVFHRRDIGTQELIQKRIKQMLELRQCVT